MFPSATSATTTTTTVTSATAAATTSIGVQPSNTPNGCAVNSSSAACAAPMMTDDGTSNDLVYYQSGLVVLKIHLPLQRNIIC